MKQTNRNVSGFELTQRKEDSDGKKEEKKSYELVEEEEEEGEEKEGAQMARNAMNVKLIYHKGLNTKKAYLACRLNTVPMGILTPHASLQDICQIDKFRIC